MKKILIAILFSVLPGSQSLADSGWFGGIGAGFVSSDDSSDTIEPINLYLRGGLSISDRFDVGVEVTSTISDDDIGSVDYDLETTLVFFKINFDLGDSKTIYAILGSTSVELTGKQGSNSVTFDDTGTAFGFGIEFRDSDSSAFIIDYISYYDDDEFDSVEDDLTVEGINLGYVSYF